MKKYVYRLQRIKDSDQWPKGCKIWALQPCKGWRVIGKMGVE